MKLRFPSLSTIIEDATKSAQRFPLTLVFSAISAAVAIWLTVSHSLDSAAEPLLWTSTLGIPFSLALTLFSERLRWSGRTKWFSQLVLIGLLVIVWFSHSWTSRTVFGLRWAQLALATHLFVAMAVYIGHGTLRGFWQFNQCLFTRFTTAAIYSLVLYLGICFALFATKALLGVSAINQDSYLQVFAIVGFLFNTWVFLSGVPKDFASLDHESKFPHGLRILTQFILVPLITLHLGILYLYGGKILLTGTWPKGIVTYLVLSVAVVGMFCNLLLDPLTRNEKSRWAFIFSKGFYIALIPLLCLLAAAIQMRIAQHGLTEKRYFVVALGIWILTNALYFTFSRSRDIRWVPISLCLFALLSSVGPWGAYAVSYRNQVHRLQNLLTENGMLQEKSVKRSTSPLPFELRKEISGILYYISTVHGREHVPDWFEKQSQKTDWYAQIEALTEELGFKFVSQWANVEDGTYFSYHQQKKVVTPIDGYIGQATISLTPHSKVSLEKPKLAFSFDQKDSTISIAGERNFVFSMESVAQKLAHTSSQNLVTIEELTVHKKSPNLKVKIVVREMFGTNLDEENKISSLTFDFYWSAPLE